MIFNSNLRSESFEAYAAPCHAGGEHVDEVVDMRPHLGGLLCDSRVGRELLNCLVCFKAMELQNYLPLTQLLPSPSPPGDYEWLPQIATRQTLTA